MKRKLTPEERERIRRLDQFSDEARANMQRIIDENEERRRLAAERRARKRRWLPFLRRTA
jgi:hypothetical protein